MEHMNVVGDVREVLREMDPQSCDAVLCDPPYELAFMGKRWDASGVSFDPATWASVLRCLRPGAHLLAAGGTRTYHRMVCAIEDAGFEIRDSIQWIYAQGKPKTAGSLKPAHEPWTLARAPGASLPLNVDACRVEGVFESGWSKSGSKPDAPGRWPANIILDEGAGFILDEQSGIRPGMSGGGKHKPGYIGAGKVGNAFGAGDSEHTARGDTGGASRFFYCAKTSTKERNAGLDEVNHHPTLKPLALTTYLARLLLPPKVDRPRRILVPFSGAGSEMIGCILAGWDEVIGVELSPEYATIAERRIAHHTGDK